MGIINKKKKKKLTTDQLITRWSAVFFVVIICVGLYFTIRNSLQDIEDSTVGNTSVFEYLNESFDSHSLVSTPISDEDKKAVKTKTTDAGLDLFKNNYMTSDKYNCVGNANDFSLTANESAFFINEIMAVTQNKYSIDYNEINISANDDEITIKLVVSMNFNAFCNITSSEMDIYKQLGYNIPSTIYLTSYAVITGESVTHQTSFNALNTDKNKEVKDFMNSKNTTDKIEVLCYNNFTKILSDFCSRTNTTYSFSSGYVNFVSTLSD